MRRSNFSRSVRRSVAAWMSMILAVLMVNIIFPFAAFVDLGKLQRDACAGSLLIMLSTGKPFMDAFDQIVAQQEPGLAPALHESIPHIMDFEQSDWTGLSWCQSNSWSWHSRLFGPFPDGGPMSVIMGSELQPGLTRTALANLAGAMKFKLEDCEKEPASLLTAADVKLAQGQPNGSMLAGWLQHDGHGPTLAHGKQPGIMMRRDSRSRLHPHATSPHLLSSSINAHGVVSPIAAKKNRWAHRHRAPGAITLQTHLRTKSAGKPLDEAAKTMAVCSTNKALNLLGMLAPVAPEVVTMMYGQVGVLDVFKSGLPLLLTFIPAVVDGICGVKLMLASSTLPGYLLMVLIMGSTPTVYIILAVLSQFFGSFFASLGFTCLMLLQGHYLRVAALFSNRKLRSSTKLNVEYSRLRTQQTILMCVFYLSMLLYVGGKLYLLKTKGNDVSRVLKGGVLAALESFKKPSVVVQMIFRMRLSALMSMLASSDLTLFMIFEVMDDDIKVKEKGLKADEATKKMVDDWHILIAGKKPKRKSEQEESEKALRKSTARRQSSTAQASSSNGSTGEAPVLGAASAAEGAVAWADSSAFVPDTDKDRSSKKSKGAKKTKK